MSIKGHHYSVSYRHVNKSVEIRYTQKTVEVFLKGPIIALHQRNSSFDGFSTNPSHRPAAHQHYADLCPEKLLKSANEIGDFTTKWIEVVLYDSSKHIRQQEKICSGVLRLAKSYGKERLEKACQRGLHYKAFSYKNILSILKNNLDQNQIEEEVPKIMILPQEHENIRGGAYYDTEGDEKVLC